MRILLSLCFMCLLFCLPQIVIAQEKTEVSPTEQQPVVKKKGFVLSTDFAISNPNQPLPLARTPNPFQAPQLDLFPKEKKGGDIKIRLLGGFSLFAEEITRTTPSEHFVPGRHGKFRLAYDWRGLKIMPLGKIHWSDKPWERELTGGVRIQW